MSSLRRLPLEGQEKRLTNNYRSYATVGHSATEWMDRAACQTAPTGLFFPEGTSGPRSASSPYDAQCRACREYCDRCPVLDCCLAFALATNQEDGYWAGMDEMERRKYRKQWLARQRRENVA